MRKFFVVLSLTLVVFTPYLLSTESVDSGKTEAGEVTAERSDGQEIPSYSLEDCLKIALERNQWRPASQQAIEIAKAQYKQAKSSLWPKLNFKSTFMHMDDDPYFQYPSQSFMLTLPTAGGMFSIPISLPDFEIKLMDKTVILNSLNVTFPLFTSGLRPAILKQAKAGVEAAKQASRRTDLQVIYDVKKYYYACVLAKKLHKVASDALARLEVTLELTENLYKKGSGRVKKTDYLRNKIVVEGLRSLLAMVKSNVDLARSALVNTMGLEWNSPLDVSETEIPYNPHTIDLGLLVSNTYEFSPDWARLHAGLTAAEAKVSEAKSGYFPKLGLVGSLNYIVNSYDGGIVTPSMKKNWMIGVGLEVPIFNGFMNSGKVGEAKARLAKLEKEKILLREGLALQVKHLFLQLKRAKDQQDASKAAMEAAEQNRDLNVRAYQDELVETQDVIESQLMESFMIAQYQKILYDHIEAQAHLDFVIGEEVQKLLK